MTWLLGLLALVVVGYLAYRWVSKSVDQQLGNNDPVLEAVKPEVTEVLDVNKDGKVNVADAVEVVEKTKKVAKKAANKVKKAKTPKLKVAK
jgi:hypothetical protein